MKIKHLAFFLAAVLCVGIATAGQAKFKIPTDVNNVKDVSGSFSGVESVKLVTSTTPALVTDSNSATITDGLVHWIVVASTNANSGIQYLELRDYATATVSTARLIPRILMIEASADTAGMQMIKFQPPIPFSSGLSVNIGPTGATPDTACEFAVGVSWKK